MDVTLVGPGEITSIIVWDAESECYIAKDPRRPGCQTDGATIEEAHEMLEDARELYDRPRPSSTREEG